MASITDPFNERVDYKLDKASRLEGISGTPFATTQSQTDYINNIDYRAWGAAKKIDYGNGVETTQKFDSRLRLEEFKVEKPGEAVNFHINC